MNGNGKETEEIATPINEANVKEKGIGELIGKLVGRKI